MAATKATPTPLTTTLPDSIFIQPIEMEQVAREDKHFKFSPNNENIIEGKIFSKKRVLNIKAVRVVFQKLPNRQETLPTIISEKPYPVPFLISVH